ASATTAAASPGADRLRQTARRHRTGGDGFDSSNRLRAGGKISDTERKEAGRAPPPTARVGGAIKDYASSSRRDHHDLFIATTEPRARRYRRRAAHGCLAGGRPTAGSVAA